MTFDALTTAERLRELERLATVTRRLRTPQHALINQLAMQASEEELGGKLVGGLADAWPVGGGAGDVGRRYVGVVVAVAWCLIRCATGGSGRAVGGAVCR